MPFVKGKSGNQNGRPKGAKDKITNEVQSLSRSILEQPAYRERVKRQAVEGTLHPKIESMLWAYAYGAPQKEESNNTGITVNLGFLQLPEPTQAKTLAISEAIEVKVITDGQE